MPFTPDNTMIIRSREYGDGSEYDGSSEGSNHIPDHYVKRLWRREGPLIGGPGGTTIQFTNKDSADRSCLYSTSDSGNLLTIKVGGYIESGAEIARVEWAAGSGKALEKSSMKIGDKTGTVKELLKKSNALSTSRVFTGPDGIEYKWKVIWIGNDPTYPEATFFTLFGKDSKHPIATTSRLTHRDENHGPTSYPLYLAERAVKMQSWVMATLVIAERLTTSK